MKMSFNTLFKSAILALGLGGTAVVPVHADEFIGGDINAELNTNEDVSVLAADVTFTGRVGGDIEGLAADISIDAEVGGDVALAGADISIAGSVGGDVDAAGANITLMANVDGDVSLAGANITIASLVGSDLAVAGAVVTLEPSSVINGEVEGHAREFYAEGQVIGSLDVEAEKVYLRGMFNGPVEVYAREVVIGPDAQFTGTVTVRGPTPPTMADGVEVANLEYIEEEWDEDRINRGDFDLDLDVGPAIASFFALSASAALIMGLLISLLFPRSMARMSVKFRERPMVSTGLGLIVWALAGIILFVIAVILAATVIGLVLAPFVMAAVPIIYFLAFVFGGVVIGDRVLNRGDAPASYLIRAASLFGVFALVGVISLIGQASWPFIVIAILLLFALSFMGFGAWTLALFDRQKKAEPQTLEGDAV